MTMITRKLLANQLPVETITDLNELRFLHHLRNAGIKKRLGFSVGDLFLLIFSLVFLHRNWFELLASSKSTDLPGKDAVYRFLNHPCFHWRKFLIGLSSDAMRRVNRLTARDRIKVLIVDDSAYERNCSKKVELLALFHDHANQCFYKGFRMLTLGWSDGHTFLPVDFALLSSAKSKLQEASQEIDKRTCGWNRRKEALQPMPRVVETLVKHSLASGMQADYLLMDSWFTHAPLLTSITSLGLPVIGMVKATSQRYQVGNRSVELKELYGLAKPVIGSSSNILRSIATSMKPGIAVKIVFVRHRKRKNEWLAILSTDTTLTETEILRIYGMRWDIETFFKCVKSLLRLQKEFQGRSYDMLVSHTTVVFARYILLSWQHRRSTDARSLGNLFFTMCDEVATKDWTVALQQLIRLLNDITQKTSGAVGQFIKKQLAVWFAALPCYIRVLLPQVTCES